MSLPRLLIIILFKRRGNWNQAPLGLLRANVWEFYGRGPDRVRVIMFFARPHCSPGGLIEINQKFWQILSQLFEHSWNPQYCSESLGLFSFFLVVFFSKDKFDYQCDMHMHYHLDSLSPSRLLKSAPRARLPCTTWFKKSEATIRPSLIQTGSKLASDFLIHVLHWNQGRNQAIC